MGENTAIEWAHHTFNPWIGCTKVGPGCDHCYAERDMDHRWGRVKWGAGQERQRTTPSYWGKAYQWNRRAEREGTRYRVFCASLADWLDNEVPIEWLVELLDLIRETPNLDWLLLTKRIGNFRERIHGAIRRANVHQLGKPLFDWLRSWENGNPPANVWLGITVVNQEEADRDIPKLLGTPAAVRWLSMEPLLGPVDVKFIGCPKCGQSENDWFPNFTICKACGEEVASPPKNQIDWIVTGGESGPNARPSHPDWFRSLRDQCAAAGTPFLFKQFGEWAPVCAQYPQTEQEHDEAEEASLCGDIVISNDGYVWPDGIQPATEGHPWLMDRVGKKAAGRTLDGQIHDGFPGVRP